MGKGLCRSCYDKSYKKKNKSKYQEYTSNWRKNNPDKIKASNAIRRERYKTYSSSVTRNEVLNLLETQTNCASCDIEFSDDCKATLDHKTPISRGGDHSVGNLHLLCFSCNASKNNKTWEEYLEWKN